MNQSLGNGHDVESLALAEEIDATLTKLASLWARLSSRQADALALDMRRALAAHGIPGGYHSRDLPPQPMAFRLKRVTECEERQRMAARMAA